MKKVIPIVLVILLPFLWIGCGYNEMQRLEEGVFTAWADIDSTLQRRMDLIPNLVNTVKGYAKYERETFEAVVRARSAATNSQMSSKDLSNPDAMAQYQQNQNALSSSLSRLMVVVERYPELKADKQYSDLMHQLEGTENRINVARTRYNDSVNKFNYSIRKFPNKIINDNFLHLERKEFFKADEQAKEVPKVEF